MKLSNIDLIGLILLFAGLCIKILSLYLQIDYLFVIGLGFSGMGIALLVAISSRYRY